MQVTKNQIFILYALSGLVILIITIPIFDLIFGIKVSPWHDELWNIYPSLKFFGINNGLWPGCQNGMCVNIFGAQLPILSGPYHGIIKSVIYAPFALLGDIDLIRLLNLAVYMMPLWYGLSQIRRIGWRALIAPIAYLLCFPGVFYEGFFDQGQLVIPNTLLYFSVLSICLIKDRVSKLSVFIPALLASLAVYEKLTNLPSLLAVYMILTYVVCKQRSWKLVFIILSPTILALPYLNYFLTGHFNDFLGMTSAEKHSYIENFTHLFEVVFDSLFVRSFALSQIFGMPVLNGNSFASLCVVVLGIIYSLIYVLKRKNKLRTVELVFVSLSVFPVLVFFPFFDGLSRPWHTYQLVPFLCGPFLVVSYAQAFENNKDRILTAFVYFIVLLIGAYNGYKLIGSVTNKHRVPPFDNSLIQTANYIKANFTETSIVCLDYSVCYNILFLLGRDYTLTAEFAFAPVDEICKNLKRINTKSYLLITHATKDRKFDTFLYGRSRYFFDNCAEYYKAQLITNNDLLDSYILYKPVER